MKFWIDEKFLTSVEITDPDSLTSDELLRILRDRSHTSYRIFRNHEEFDKLRDTLRQEKYIKRVASDGERYPKYDLVIAPFELNGQKFEPNHVFLDADGMRILFKTSRNITKSDVSNNIVSIFGE